MITAKLKWPPGTLILELSKVGLFKNSIYLFVYLFIHLLIAGNLRMEL